MSIVRAVRTLVDSVQGLPEAARREIIDILDELEGKPAPVEVAAPVMYDPEAVESPTEAPVAPDAETQESAVEPAATPAESDPADAPVNTQVS